MKKAKEPTFLYNGHRLSQDESEALADFLAIYRANGGAETPINEFLCWTVMHSGYKPETLNLEMVQKYLDRAKAYSDSEPCEAEEPATEAELAEAELEAWWSRWETPPC